MRVFSSKLVPTNNFTTSYIPKNLRNMTYDVGDSVIRDDSLGGITHDGSKFVLLSKMGHVSTSTDAVNWTEPVLVNTLKNLGWNDLIYVNGIYIACSINNRFAWSNDAVTWTLSTSTSTSYFNWKCLFYVYRSAKYCFMAIGQDSNDDWYKIASNDGKTWKWKEKVTQLNSYNCTNVLSMPLNQGASYAHGVCQDGRTFDITAGLDGEYYSLSNLSKNLPIIDNSKTIADGWFNSAYSKNSMHKIYIGSDFYTIQTGSNTFTPIKYLRGEIGAFGGSIIKSVVHKNKLIIVDGDFRFIYSKIKF